MPGGPSIIFDKSSLESLSLDEAVLMDNFYMSNITPLLYVECLADLEKQMRSNSTPEQLVGSLADRTPEAQGMPNVHHLSILQGELSRQFDLAQVHGRVAVAGGEPVQLGDKKGFVFRRTPEAEAFERWTCREFLDVERNLAKQWRRALTGIDLNALSCSVLGELGHWRKPKDLEDAKHLADIAIDTMDPEWLLRFGLNLLGVPEATEWVLQEWISRRRPPLREHVPYFIFMLTINIFFCLVLPTQLLRNVKASHQIDLAYLYYLPFCSVFTSKDNFHIQVAPLFLAENQQFINGIDFKDDLKRLNELYSALPADVLKTGLINFAAHPPEDSSYIVTRMWDQFLPRWRAIKSQPKPQRDPEEEKRLVEEINHLSDENLPSHDERDIDKVSYAQITRLVRPKKGKWLRFSEEQIRRIYENQAKRSGESGEPSLR
jgi:hypothetical protein